MRTEMVVADTTNLIRTTVVYVKGFDIGGTFSNFFANGISGAPDVTSQFLPYGRGKAFEVLYDKTTNLTANGSNAQIIQDISIPINRTITYQVGSPVSLAGNVYLLLMSDSNAAPHPSFKGTTRLYFKSITL